jgi:Heterokaryon incompatibility protein (HET)
MINPKIPYVDRAARRDISSTSSVSTAKHLPRLQSAEEAPRDKAATVALKYDPLCENTSEIRLLHVQPASSSDEAIICDLRVVSLHEPNQYVVTRGLSKPELILDHIILCNQKPLPVTRDVYSRLRSLRQLHWQWIWAHQICIDFSSIHECNQQAALKAAIYQQALHVFHQLPMYYNEPSSDPVLLDGLDSASREQRLEKIESRERAYRNLYKPLDPAKGEIRILLCLGLNYSDGAREPLFALSKVSLKALPISYHAISYTWGDSTPTETIWLGYMHHISFAADGTLNPERIVFTKLPSVGEA